MNHSLVKRRILANRQDNQLHAQRRYAYIKELKTAIQGLMATHDNQLSLPALQSMMEEGIPAVATVLYRLPALEGTERLRVYAVHHGVCWHYMNIHLPKSCIITGRFNPDLTEHQAQEKLRSLLHYADDQTGRIQSGFRGIPGGPGPGSLSITPKRLHAPR